MNSTFQILVYYGEPNVEFTENDLTTGSTIEKKGILIPFINTNNKKLRLVSIDCIHLNNLFDVVPMLCSFSSPQLFNSNGAETKIYFTSSGPTSFNDNFYLNSSIMNNQNIDFTLRNVDLTGFAEFIDNFQYFLMNIEIC